MGDVVLGSASLTSDSDGFLSRRCPACSGVFKRTVARINAAEFPAPYCPYCSAPNEGDWYTQEQEIYLQASMSRAASNYVQNQLGDMLKGLQSEFFTVTPGKAELPPDPGSPPVDSAEGFVRVDVPCHEDDSFKVVATTGENVACIVCGIPYPVSDVAQLGAD